MAATSLDIGTMNLIKGDLDPMVGDPAFTVERNVFLQAASGDDTEDVLKENNWSYAKYDDKYYILGEEAIKIKNMLTIDNSGDNSIIATKIGELRRPMKDGLLNTAEEKLSVAIIQTLIGNLLGKPKKKGDVLCFCVPGNPIDRSVKVVFHQAMLTKFLKGLGYTVECIPEALAIIFSEAPSAADPDEPDNEAPFSGISFSFGAGMCNTSFVWKKLPLINFAMAKCGDWIDNQVAAATGKNVSSVTKYKEKHLDLDNIDYSNTTQAALDIFYQNMIEYSLSNFAEKFNSLDKKIDSPLEIVIAGGTASVPGFLNKFKAVLEEQELPFSIKSVRLAENPLYAVSNGCLVKALSVEKKKNKQEKPSE